MHGRIANGTRNQPAYQSPSDDFINRRVAYRFAGVDLKLDLSLGLFASAGIDSGSMLLLKSIAGEINLDALKRVLDVGCGVGTLGLALAARCPDASIRLVDRDALALSFSAHNAKLNQIRNVTCQQGLMLEGPHEEAYDLIVSNFPAKAGDPVLADYLNRSPRFLSPGGRAAVVIVHTLAERCRELIEATGAKILHHDASKQHAVFHYAFSDAGESGSSNYPTDELKCYLRHEGEFRVKRTRYTAETVWNIGDFDTLSWRLNLMGELLNAEPPFGSLLFWSPGQGHLPLLCCRHRGARPTRILLAGRDRLELLVSRRNLQRAQPDLPVEILPLYDPGLLADEPGIGSHDLFLTDLSPVPRSQWTEPLKRSAGELVHPGGKWAVVGRSADLADLTKSTKGWTPIQDKRHRGWRALVLRRNQSPEGVPISGEASE